MYAVMGVTGKVGGAVAKTLLTAGQPLRAIVREAAKGKVWTDRGCEVAVAKTEDPDALAKAFVGVEGVFVMLPSSFDPSPGFDEARALIESLRTALEHTNPAKVVCLSTIGADATRPNLLAQLGLLELALATLPIPVTFLRAAWFIENSALDVESARTDGRIDSFLQPLDRPVPMVATDDVGATAARLLMETWEGRRVVEVEGPRRVTPKELANAFTESLHRPVAAKSVPRAEWDALFRAQGMRNPLPRIQMLDGFNEGWIEFKDGGAHARRGVVTAEQVIRELVGSTS
jgi:uncharacterized protein YbjT (DUF2867 family)